MVCHVFLSTVLSNSWLCCRAGCKRYCGLCPGFPVGTTPESAFSTSPAKPPSSPATASQGSPEASPTTPTNPGFPVAPNPTLPPGSSPSESTGTFACVDVAPPGSPYNCAQQVCSISVFLCFVIVIANGAMLLSTTRNTCCYPRELHLLLLPVCPV